MASAAAAGTQRTAAAKALSSALLLCIVAPWTLCLLSYTFLHATYPRDKALAAIKSTAQHAFLEAGLHGAGGRLKAESKIGGLGTSRRRPPSD